MKITAYHRWLYESTRGNKLGIKAMLYGHVIKDRNPQAFDLLEETGDKVFSHVTFDKAADIVIKLNQENATEKL